MSVCDLPVISSVCSVGNAAGGIFSSVAGSFFDWIAQAVGGAAKWMFETVWKVFDSTTLVDVTSPSYLKVYDLIFGVAVFIMLIFFCLQLIGGLIKRDPTALSRAALGLGKSVLGSFVVITLTGLALQITDELCTGIIQAAGETVASMGDKIALLAAGLLTINVGSPGVGAIITIFLAGLALSAAAIVWFSLLVRKSLLLVAIVFAPLAFSGASWDATKGWIHKWSMFVIALIVSKLVLVMMVLVAVAEVSTPIDADLNSITDPIAGVVIMGMAAFAPYLAYKFISFVGFDMYHAIGAEQDAKNAMNRPIPTPTKPQGSEPKKVLNDSSKSGGNGGPTGKASSDGKGGTPPAPKPSAPSASGPATGEGTTAAGTAEGGAGAGAAAAGPAAAAVVAAEVAKKAFTAGPKAGAAVGGAAEGHADAAVQNNGSTPPAPQTPPPSAPGPMTPGPSQPTPPNQPSTPNRPSSVAGKE